MGPKSRSAKKAKTPGPASKQKTAILKRKALSEGGPITKAQVSQLQKKGQAKMPNKSKAADEKIKLTFGEDSDEEDTVMVQKTPAGGKGKQTPKSAGKSKPAAAEAKTPKGAAQNAMSGRKKTPNAAGNKGADTTKQSAPETPKAKTPKGTNLKKSGGAKSVSKKEPASAGGKPKETKEEDPSSAKLPFDVEDDYDEDEDGDFDMDDADDDDSETDESDGEFDEDDDDDEDDAVLDDDDLDEDYDEDEEEEEEESGSSYSDASEMSFESNESDEEISFNPSAKIPESKRTPKADKAQEMTKIVSKSSTTPKGTKDIVEDTEGTKEKASKTPKSSLKAPGTATNTGKKVSLVVTSPEREERSKKVVSTPHPSLTKKSHTGDGTGDGDKEIKNGNGIASSSESEGDEDPLHKQLSFVDEEEEAGGKKLVQSVKVEGQSQKRKRKESEKEDESDEEEVLSPDGIYYHCGNLPPSVSKQMVEWFFAEADVELDRIILHRENVERTESTAIKKSKGKYRKQKRIVHHCFAILKCKSEEDAKKLQALNGTEFTAPDGKWRTYTLTIYPMLGRKAGPKGTIKDENCCHIRPLNLRTADEDLKQFFKENGVEPVSLRVARRGVRQISKGYALAWFKSEEDAKKALTLSGKMVMGFKPKITMAKVKIQGPKKYNYKIGSNLDIKERDIAEAAVKKQQKKKLKTV